MNAEEEHAQIEVGMLLASAAMDQYRETVKPFFAILAGFEQTAVTAGLSYSVAAKLTVQVAESFGFPWLRKP